MAYQLFDSNEFSERENTFTLLAYATRSDSNQAIHPQKMDRGLKSKFMNQSDCTSYVAKNKGGDLTAVWLQGS